MKAQPGLSLLEVLLAVLIVGVSVTTILGLQGVLSRGVFKAHGFIDRIPFVRSFFVEADKEKRYQQAESFKKVLDDPALTMTYSTGTPASKDLKNLSHMLVERVDAQWPSLFGLRTEQFARLRFVPAGRKKS